LTSQRTAHHRPAAACRHRRASSDTVLAARRGRGARDALMRWQQHVVQCALKL
jgi:hypothetical protein